MLTLYQKIEKHFSDNLPFVVYSKPYSSKIIGLFQENSKLHKIQNYDEKGFAFVSFDGKSKYLISIEHSTTHLTNFIKSNEKIEIPDIFDDFNEQNKFENIVKKAILTIKKGEFEKVVLSRKEVLNLNLFDFIKSFEFLLENYPAAFKYLIFHPKAGLWMGATPEKFIEINNNQLKTMALAGTQLFSENIKWTSKEIKEQEIVTEFIKNQLKKYTSKIKISKPFTFQAGNLAHIRTDIEAEVMPIFKKHIIDNLHPTPAVCGMPKENSKEFILQNEGYDREFYSGFLGELNMNDGQSSSQTDLYVNLRCMKIEDKKVSLFVGCGITADSNPTQEFLETVNKSKTIKNIIVS